VGADPEGNLVDVGLEDLPFRVARLDLQGDQQLTELAHVGAVKAEEEVLGQLLGDGGSALDPAAARQRHPEGFHRAQLVKSVVLPEPVVLGGGDGLDE
jgi:hypothetical protein